MNSRPASPVVRLSGPDLINLAAETDDTPMHVGVLAVLDGASLLDADGRLRLADLRAEIHGRLSAVPRLTQILRPAWPLAGHPLWTECRRLQIEQHVTEVTLPGTATSTTS